jgi:putative transposase
MDFMTDALSDGRRFRLLIVLDQRTRECLAIEVDTSLPGGRVIEVLKRLAAERGVPEVLVIDNGPEFAGRALDQWAYPAGRQAPLHCAWQADPERLRGELQRQAAG